MGVGGAGGGGREMIKANIYIADATYQLTVIDYG